MRGGEYLLNFGILTEKEKGYLFGLFEGDGYSFHNKKDRHYSVEFYLNSERNLGIFRFLDYLLRKLKLNPLLMKDKRFKCIRIRVNSKNFFNFINQNYDPYLKSNDFCIGFLSGFIDAEGYVNPKIRTTNVVNTNLKIMETISKILKKNRINNKISLRKKSIKDKKKSYVIYIPESFKRLNHLSIKAGKDLRGFSRYSGVES